MPKTANTLELSALYEPALEAVIARAFGRLQQTLRAAGPTIAERTHAWMDSMGGTDRQVERYKHPLSYPMLLLPWWAEKLLQDPPDFGRQTGLAYSTICGYYAIRLIDNLMDGHGTVEADVLPVLHVLAGEFQTTYQRSFAALHGFWELFREVWYRTAEATLRDSSAMAIDRAHFTAATAHKTEAVIIPMAAVCYEYSRADLIAPWAAIVDTFGCWHQMCNDLYDWRKDLELGTTTYLLSEAERRRASDEPMIAWVAREGFEWAMCTLDEWMAELKDRAQTIGSRDLLAYLQTRDQMLRDRATRLRDGLCETARLFEILARARQSEE